MRIPSSVTIGVHRFKVREGTEDETTAHGRMGFFDCKKGEIVIAPGFPKPAQFETYIHELVEAVNWVYDLNLPHPTIQDLAIGMANAYVSGKGRLGG